LQAAGLSETSIQTIVNGTTKEQLQAIGLNDAQIEFFDNLVAFQQNPNFENLDKTGLLANLDQNQISYIQVIFGYAGETSNV